MSDKEKYPSLYIQCDWNEVLRSPESKVFITAKYRGTPSVHGYIKASLTSVGEKLKLITDPIYTIVNHNSNAIIIKHNDSGLVTAFIAPMKTFALHKKSVYSVSASDETLVVSSCEDDKVIVWDSRTGDQMILLEGHGGPAYKCRFFPSGTVVLTAGADGSLKVWSAEDGRCPVTLKGHTKSVTDIAIVDKGRNVISVSKDGYVKLWDVGESKCLTNIYKSEWEINCCCLMFTPDYYDVADSREVGTENKLVFIGCENGSFYCSQVATRQLLYLGKLESAINCCEQIENNVIVGCENGKIVQLSRDNGSVVSEWWDSSNPVTSLRDLSNNKFAAGRMDGSCVIYSLLPQHAEIRVQLTGPDIDSIRDIAFNGRWVFTSCRDGSVRKYDFNQIAVHFR